MVNYSPRSLDGTFAALADPTRRAIVERLATRDLTVSEIADPFPISLPAMLKHLGVLEKAGLLQTHKTGRVRTCSLIPSALDDADQWLGKYRSFWTGQLDSLERHLEQRHKTEKPNNA